MDSRPAYADAFRPEAIRLIDRVFPASVTREWAWGGSAGAGVKVAVVDSGIDADHPAVRASGVRVDDVSSVR